MALPVDDGRQATEPRYVKYQRRTKKPGPTAKARAKRRRAEQPVAATVRALCVERDGYCRLMGVGPCEGPSEWAHLAEKKRARTRGMTPEQRHTTTHSAMFCRQHHRLYDAGKIELVIGQRGADAPMFVTYTGGTLVLAC